MLELVTGLGKSSGQALLGIAHHPAEDLRGGRKCHELRAEPRLRAYACGSACGERVAEGRRREERAEKVRPAAIVLLGRALALLVAADRDVLGAVIRGDVGATEGECCRREGEQAAEQLLRARADRPGP